jgi:hypothetical protein
VFFAVTNTSTSAFETPGPPGTVMLHVLESLHRIAEPKYWDGIGLWSPVKRTKAG